MILYCAACGEGHPTDSQGNISERCPDCKAATVWTSEPLVAVVGPVKITNDDYTFLRVQKIRPD